MNVLQKLGGRKFLMSLLVVGVGTAIEMHTERGMSSVFAGLLAAILATFSASNYATTKQHLNTTKGGSSGEGGLHNKLDEILDIAKGSGDAQVAQVLVQTLEGLSLKMDQVHTLTKQTGQAVVNIAKRGQV